MTTTIKEQNGEIVAFFEGSLDTAAAQKTEKDIQPLLTADKNIVLNCEKLEYISSSGLRIILQILKAAKLRGLHVSATGMNKDILKVFTLTGFNNLLELK